MRLRRTAPAFAAASILLIAALSGCVAEPAAPSGSTGPDTVSASPGATPEPSRSPQPTASPSPADAAIPTDCRAMLTPAVLSQLEGVPLNDPAAGIPTGVLPDGSLACLWRDPRADTTNLFTTISRLSRGPALDMMNDLADAQGYTCYTPDGGTRCEKTWVNTVYPVTDGRTLFWREDVLIDTRFSNLAPSGYTSAIVAGIFG